jgi:hypothetical protein
VVALEHLAGVASHVDSDRLSGQGIVGTMAPLPPLWRLWLLWARLQELLENQFYPIVNSDGGRAWETMLRWFDDPEDRSDHALSKWRFLWDNQMDIAFIMDVIGGLHVVDQRMLADFINCTEWPYSFFRYLGHLAQVRLMELERNRGPGQPPSMIKPLLSVIARVLADAPRRPGVPRALTDPPERT